MNASAHCFLPSSLRRKQREWQNGFCPDGRIIFVLLVLFVASTGPAFLSESRLSDIDLGSRIEFLSSLGLEWEFAENWRLSYRFAHLSNAGISNKNPGLNLHLFGIGVRI